MSQPVTKIAVIGCGYWGRHLVRNFSGLGALAAVVDANRATAEGYAAQYDVAALSLSEALAEPDINAVVIAAPAEQHADLALRALAAGKHVYVEKPLALTTADAEQVIAAAREAGLTLMVGHLLRYHPAFTRLLAMAREGALGRLQYIYSNRLNFGKIRREENVIWSFAPHDISMILALTGELPERVSAKGSNYLHDRIADITTTDMSFPGGINAHIFVSWLHPYKEQKLVVVGDKAMAVFDDTLAWPEKLVVYDHVIEWKAGMPEPKKADGRAVALQESEPLRNECQHFLDAIINHTRPITDGAEGLRVLRVLDAAQRAMSSGDAVSLEQSAEVTATDFFVHESSFVDDGVEIGDGTRIWHFCHILGNVRIGRNCVLGQNIMVGPDVSIGDGCKIQNNVSLFKGITLEDGVFCGPSCVFTNVNNPRAEIERKEEFRPTLVKRGASIGANATIVCGNSLGEYCFIAAGAVVTTPVPAYAMMAGVPAVRIGWMSAAGHKLGDDLVCPETGQRYHATSPDHLEPLDS